MRIFRTLSVILSVFLTLPAFDAVSGEADFTLPTPPVDFEAENYRPVGEKERKDAKLQALDNFSRQSVTDFYNNEYLPSNGVAIAWNGSIGECNPGDTSTDFKNAVLRRVNYYRVMAGLPGDCVFDSTYNAKSQKMALMMIAENDTSDPHNPTPDWTCYDADGDEAAGKSNLAKGRYGPHAINGYMEDPGTYNFAVGHRRWILYPPLKNIGTGDSDAQNGYYYGSNCLWVLSGWGTRPTTPDGVAWPPAGYVPYNLVFPRWSFSFNGGNFNNASITITHQGQNVDLTVAQYVQGYGDNTIVWVPDGIPTGSLDTDLTYNVEISNVIVNTAPTTFSYDVIIFDPEKPGPAESTSGYFLY